MINDNDKYAINNKTYEWSVRLFSLVKQLLKVNICFHHDHQQLVQGDIFLFNHFARFETFIPQYLIYKASGAYCRSVASREFFQGDERLANYLRGVGAMPNDYPKLLPFLAAEILHGRKVIIFPEGGMVKDRRVMEKPGHYSVYSRTARERRKQHRGAAVLALGLDAYKARVLQAEQREERSWLEQQVQTLSMNDVDALLAAARKPTQIVPANITFYPLRVNDNLLRKGMELLNRGLSRRASEELLIEGNILLKNTDMDIRLSDALAASDYWAWWDKPLLNYIGSALDSLDSVFDLQEHAQGLLARGAARSLKRRSEHLRDRYMHEMYLDVTVNLSHLAASLIFQCRDAGLRSIEQSLFWRALYLAIKYVQQCAEVHLHHGIDNPDEYAGLLQGESLGLEQFMVTALQTQLFELQEHTYVFSDKLYMAQEFDAVRLENMMEVFANEVAPLTAVTEAVARALQNAAYMDDADLSGLRFDDELRAYEFNKQAFSATRFADINAQQTATADPRPYWHLPKQKSRLGVVLVHGFLSSPAELRDFGERLAADGYAVLGVRLPGHGTSPWDLRNRSWPEWLASVRRGYEILLPHVEQVCLLGFSTGGALVLRLAAEQPAGLAGVAAINVPIHFRNKNMMLVPLVHGANRLVSWLSTSEGVKPFLVNESEHPLINYRHIPMHGLYELRQLVADLEAHLSEVVCPALLVQADQDPVVVPESAEIVHAGIASNDKQLVMISAQRHGIVNEGIANTHAVLLSFLERLTRT